MNLDVCSPCPARTDRPPLSRSRESDRFPGERSAEGLTLALRRWLYALADNTAHADAAWGAGESVKQAEGASPGRSESGFAADSDTRPLSEADGGSIQMILIVEDDPINRKILRRMLQRLGYAYEMAENGKEAIELLQAGAYDGVLMDIRMPVMDGIVATKKIRRLRDPKLATVPIIAVTAQALEGNRETCIKMGFDDYLPKPVTRASLGASLERVLAKRL